MDRKEFPALVDISEWRIDPALPAAERLRIFAAQAGDPHRFRVGETAVTVAYSDGAPDLQHTLADLCRRLQ